VVIEVGASEAVRIAAIGTAAVLRRYLATKDMEATTMRGVLLWLLGVPISVIILLYLFHVI
jgi:hypothetical protein